MKQYVGLDVSMKATSICIVDKGGKVIREAKVATEPTAILAVLMDETLAIDRVRLEAGAYSQWLYGALAEAGLPVVCVETRHMKAALSAQRNKTDRNDARGIAQMMENLYGYKAIESYRSAARPIDPSLTQSNTVITTYGRDFAVASTLSHRANQQGKVGRQMQTWVRFPEGWKVVAAHVSKIDEPK